MENASQHYGPEHRSEGDNGRKESGGGETHGPSQAVPLPHQGRSGKPIHGSNHQHARDAVPGLPAGGKRHGDRGTATTSLAQDHAGRLSINIAQRYLNSLPLAAKLPWAKNADQPLRSSFFMWLDDFKLEDIVVDGVYNGNSTS